MQYLQLFLLSHVIPRHVLFSSADSGANGTYYCFVYPKFSRQRDPTCAVDASWPLGGMNFIAPLVLFELYICVKILKFTKSSHFTKKHIHQSIIYLHRVTVRPPGVECTEVPSNKFTLKIKKRKKRIWVWASENRFRYFTRTNNQNG